MSGTYRGTQLEDDIHLPDAVELSAGTLAAPIGTTATDLTVDGAGGTGPSCPDNFTMVLESVTIENAAAGTAQITLQRYNGTKTVVIGIFALATKTSLLIDETRAKFICPPGYRFQLLSDTAASAIINGLARLVKGASASS